MKTHMGLKPKRISAGASVPLGVQIINSCRNIKSGNFCFLHGDSYLSLNDNLPVQLTKYDEGYPLIWDWLLKLLLWDQFSTRGQCNFICTDKTRRNAHEESVKVSEKDTKCNKFRRKVAKILKTVHKKTNKDGRQKLGHLVACVELKGKK